MHSSIEISMAVPLPVFPRSTSAARIDEKAYMPAVRSAIEMPTLQGCSGVPVSEMTPLSPCTSRSNDFLVSYGPPLP
jgi:hypothetical protein